MRVRPLVLAVTTLATMAAVLLGVSAPAQAATADRWAFAYVNDPTVPVWTNLDPAHQGGTFAGLAQGGKIAPGRFLVRFPGIGFGSRGNVHVTPVNRDGTYCEIVRWYASGVDEIIDVQCHKPGGANADTRFTVLWTVSSGVLPATATGSYASVQYGPAAIVQSYNSTGGGITVVPGGVGFYQVRFALVGVVGQLSGNVEVTAVQPNAQPRRCKVAKIDYTGTDILAFVACFNQLGNPINSEFTASYHRERTVIASFPPKYFGYIWTAGGGQTNFNYPAGGFGFNTVSPLFSRYLVKYPWLVFARDHAQVTAYGNGNVYCHLTDLWKAAGTTIEVDVSCFNNAGTMTPHTFFTTFTNNA